MSKKLTSFQEAVADAKELRESAMAVVKLSLAEHFTPTLKKMIDAKLNEDLDEETGEYDEDTTDEVDETKKEEDPKKEEPEEDEKKDDSELNLESLLKELEDEDASKEDDEVDESKFGDEEKDGEKGHKPMDEKKDGEEGSEDDEELAQYKKLKEKFEPKEKDEDDSEEKNDDEVDETLDIDALLKEIEDDKEGEEDEVKEAYADPKKDGEKGVKPMDEEDSKGSLKDRLIKGATGAIADFVKDFKNLKDPETRKEFLQSLSPAIGNSQGITEVEKLSADLNEVNLLNAKYLFFIKTVNENTSLTQNEKVGYLKQFDKCATVKEVKLVYSTISESFKSSKKDKSKKTLKESFGMASKPAGNSTAKNKDVIDPGVERFKRLAGLI